MRKGVFIDLDGTLLNNRKAISPFDKQAIKMTVASGIDVFLVTGKSLRNALPWYQELQLQTPYITSMGQVISKPYDASFKPILNLGTYSLLKAGVDAVAKYMPVANFLFETYDGTVHVQKCNNSNLVRLISEQCPIVCMVDQGLVDVIGSYVEVGPQSESQIKAVVDKLNSEYAGRLEFSYWLTDGDLPIINIKPEHIGKSVAVDIVCRQVGIDYVIAFGNGWNDRNMLHHANEGYAMLNATASVKKFAAFVTTHDNNDSGVGRTLVTTLQLPLKPPL